MLNPTGEIGMYYLSNAAVFNVYESMSKNTKWASYLEVSSSFLVLSLIIPTVG